MNVRLHFKITFNIIKLREFDLFVSAHNRRTSLNGNLRIHRGCSRDFPPFLCAKCCRIKERSLRLSVCNTRKIFFSFLCQNMEAE